MNDSAENYQRFLNGDMEGLTQIVGAYREGLILYLHTYVRDVYLAEDLTEETFVKLILKKPRLKNNAAFKTWLYTIAGNVARDHLRSRKFPEISLEECPNLTDRQELEHAYIQQEKKRLVRGAMENLKPEYRQVLWLVYFEGFSNKEAARVLRKTVHNTEVLVSRARKALKGKLLEEGYCYEE